MKKSLALIATIILLVFISIFIGIKIIDLNQRNDNNQSRSSYLLNSYEDNLIAKSVEISSEEEKTTPNTLIIYKIYYTKCKHYIKKYEIIDASKVNLTEEEFKEKYKSWRLDSFSSKEIELSKEEEKFCGEHFKIKLKDNVVCIYRVDEDGKETEYEITDITKEYLTNDDILRLTNGIIVYGKESLTSTIEDYE